MFRLDWHAIVDKPAIRRSRSVWPVRTATTQFGGVATAPGRIFRQASTEARTYGVSFAGTACVRAADRNRYAFEQPPCVASRLRICPDGSQPLRNRKLLPGGYLVEMFVPLATEFRSGVRGGHHLTASGVAPTVEGAATPTDNSIRRAM